MSHDSEFLAIFDHDGVLVDSLPYHIDAWVQLGRREHLPITPEFIHATFGMTNPSIFARLLGGDVDPAKIERYGQIKEECYRDLASGKITLMDGVRPLIETLGDRGFKLAIGSSGVLPNLRMTVRECGLEGRFAAIASLEDISRGKPDPEVFLVAAKKTGVDPNRGVVFEDAPVGIQAAKAAGMLAVGVTTTVPGDTLYDAGADLVVNTLAQCDVDDILERLRKRRDA